MCNLPAFMVYFFNVFLEKSELFNPIYLFSMSSGGLLKWLETAKMVSYKNGIRGEVSQIWFDN